MDPDTRSSPSWLQLVLSCIGTAVVVFGLENTLLSSRVTVADEEQFRKSVERRLLFLESSDLRALTVIEKHRDEDTRIFQDVERRLREVEVDSARIISRLVVLEKNESKKRYGGGFGGGASLQRRVDLLDPLLRTQEEREREEMMMVTR